MLYFLLLTFILAPAYVIKFNLLRLPSDILMVWVVIVWLVFFAWVLAKKQAAAFWVFLKKFDSKILILAGLFFLAGLISFFFEGIDRAKLGQFLVLFVQPMSIFFIAAFVLKENPKAKSLLLTICYLLLALAGAYAILQYFTLIGLPPGWWGNSVEPKRSLSFFIHPNFYALWSAPLLALLIPDLGLKIKDLRKHWPFALAWILGGIGLLLSFSRAGWLGLAAAVAVYLIVGADKKIRRMIFGAVIVTIIIIVSVPNLRWRLILPFYGEKSADSRIELWQSGWKGVKESPILGLGLNGFAKQYRRRATG